MTKLPKSPYTQIEIPDIDSIIKFMDYMNDDDTVMLNTKVFFNLAVWTGMRTEELLALTWDDVNFRQSVSGSQKQWSGLAAVPVCKRNQKAKAA